MYINTTPENFRAKLELPVCQQFHATCVPRLGRGGLKFMEQEAHHQET